MDKFIIRLSSPQDQESINPIPKPVESDGNINSPSTSKVCSGRKFQNRWKTTFPWILYDKVLDKVFCNVCKEAVASNLLPPGFTTKDKDANKSFSCNGFSQWNKAIERFKIHEKSSIHRSATVATASQTKGTNVSALLSKSKLEEMKNARKALMTIISSLKYLGQQGLAIRGHTDKCSNIHQLLQLRAEDVPELKSWLQRTKYKWISHEVLNELISLLATDVLSKIICCLKEAQYFALIIDETMDISTKEQISICFRYVDKNLQIEEVFVGFYETSSTTSATLLNIVLDVLMRYNLEIGNCRGQCYDGASNVSGHITGLQKRIKELEQRAIFVHCAAHNLNLVVQDAMQNIYCVRDFLIILREIIAFVRNSPKRLSIFQSLQDDNSSENVPRTSLRPFCPTRWCIRVKSMKTLESNYDALLKLLEEISRERSEAGGKASGFLANMQTFKFLFLLNSLILIFDQIEIVNSVLQSKTLIYNDVKLMIENLFKSLMSQRNKFHDLWTESVDKAKKLNIEEPILPRSRKMPKRYDEGSDPYVFETPEKMFRQIFFEIIDLTVNSLKNRFQKDVMEHISEFEAFAVGKADAEETVKFYGSDLDKDKLTLHRDMFLDVCKSKNEKVSNIQDVVNILGRENNCYLRELLPEFVKFVRIFLTIPVTSCTSERSFSALRRLKTFLRSTMTQKRLNDLAILHIYKDSINVDMNKIANMFINACEIRKNVFYVES